MVESLKAFLQINGNMFKNETAVSNKTCSLRLYTSYHIYLLNVTEDRYSFFLQKNFVYPE